MEDELALLRGIAANPYERARLGAYADWLDEHDRPGEAAIVRGHALAAAPLVNGNSISVGELVGHLLTMPLDAPVIYRRCSDWSELQRDEVTLHRAEDKAVIWREQNGYSDYEERWFKEGVGRYYTDGRYYGEQPHFVTVCCFPGN